MKNETVRNRYGKYAVLLLVGCAFLLSSCEETKTDDTDGSDGTYTNLTVTVNAKTVLFGGTVNFGDLVIGAAGRSFVFTLANTGETALAYSLVFEDSSFSASQTSGSIAAGASAAVTVTFNPIHAGAKEGQMQIKSSNLNSEIFPITLKGNSLPVTMATIPQSSCYGVAVSGNHAYYAAGSPGLVVYDIADPSSPTLAGSRITLGNAYDVFISGNYAYVADYSGGLVIIDISDPTAPVIAGSTNGTSNDMVTARAVVVKDSVAYVSDYNNGLYLIDISNPSAPVQVGYYAATYYGQSAAVDGNYAYFIDSDASIPTGSSTLKVINVSNPASPVLVSSVSTVGSARDVVYGNGKVYIAEGASGLSIFDVSAPSSPAILSYTTASAAVYTVALQGNYIYMGSTVMSIVDVSNEFVPTIVGSIGYNNYIYGICESNGYVYIAHDMTTGRVIQVAD